MEIFLIVFFSYLSGSIPFGLILTRLFSGKDIRSIGSGNIGATNVLRTGNKYLAGTTLILDAAKGFIPAALTQSFFPEYFLLSSLLALLGHIFPVWLNFKGGKGVATYLGILFAFSFGLGFLFVFVWMIVSLIFKYSSVSSIFASFSVLIITIIRENFVKTIYPDYPSQENIILILFIFFILIVFTHRKNIFNLKNGLEKKIKL